MKKPLAIILFVFATILFHSFVFAQQASNEETKKKTLVVDLKIDGQDGPINIPYDKKWSEPSKGANIYMDVSWVVDPAEDTYCKPLFQGYGGAIVQDENWGSRVFYGSGASRIGLKATNYIMQQVVVLQCAHGDQIASDSVYLNFGRAPTIIYKTIFLADDKKGPISVPWGAVVKLKWESNYPTNGEVVCRGMEDWSGDKKMSGEELVGPLYEDKIFQLYCSGANALFKSMIPSFNQMIVVHVEPELEKVLEIPLFSICDQTALDFVNNHGGCSEINAGLYENAYEICCLKNKETLKNSNKISAPKSSNFKSFIWFIIIITGEVIFFILAGFLIYKIFKKY